MPHNRFPQGARLAGAAASRTLGAGTRHGAAWALLSLLAGRDLGSVMPDMPGALDKLYSMLREADQLDLSRSARLRLIGIIGSFENEELDRYRRSANGPREREGEPPHRRDSEDGRLVEQSRF